MEFFVYLFFFSFFIMLFVLWKCVYFKSISVVLIEQGRPQLVSVRPSPPWFKSLRSSRSCFVSLGSGYVAWQCCHSDDEVQSYSELVNVDSSVYIFRSKFGRLRSIDLSDRRLSDILKKYR